MIAFNNQQLTIICLNIWHKGRTISGPTPYLDSCLLRPLKIFTHNMFLKLSHYDHVLSGQIPPQEQQHQDPPRLAPLQPSSSITTSSKTSTCGLNRSCQHRPAYQSQPPNQDSSQDVQCPTSSSCTNWSQYGSHQWKMMTSHNNQPTSSICCQAIFF